MAIRNNSNNDKKTTTTTTVKTLKGKNPPVSPMKSAEAYAEQAQQENPNSKKTNTKITDAQSSLLKRLGIAGGIVAVLLGGLFAVEHFNKPEKPNEALPPLSSPLVIPDAPSLASNNPEKPVFLEIQPPIANSQNPQDPQNLENLENLQNQSDIFAPPESNITAEKSTDEIAKIDLTKNNLNPEKNSQNLVENKQNPQNLAQLPAADSFGTFDEPVVQAPINSSKNNNNSKMQQGGHTILKLNQPQSQQQPQPQNPPSKKNEIATIAANVEKPPKQTPRSPQLPQNFVAEETFAPPMLGSNKTGAAIADSKNLPNVRIVSMSKNVKNNAENSVIPNDKYRIQAGVFDSKVNPQSAENLYQKLVSAGIPAVLENRVQVGPFANKAQAEKAQQKLKELGISGVIVVPNN